MPTNKPKQPRSRTARPRRRKAEFLSEHLHYAEYGAKSLLKQKSSLDLTPLQAVLQYFERQHVGESLAIALKAFREVLDLLPECDWSEVHPDGWVAMDPEGERKSTITSPEILFERHLAPLLGPLDEIEDRLYLTDPAEAADAIFRLKGRDWAAQFVAAVTELRAEEVSP